MTKIHYNLKNKNMKNRLIYLSIILISTILVGCEEEGVLPVDLPAAISFNLESDTVLVPPGGSTYDLELQSTTTSDADRTYTITLNEDLDDDDNPNTTGLPDEYSLESTSITIPAGELKGSSTITFDYDAIPLGVSRTLYYDLDEISDDSFLNSSRDKTIITYSALCPYNAVTITFYFDAWPEEAYWQLFDSDDNLLDGDGYSGTDCYVDLTSNPKIFCLEDGDYQFLMGDCYGDGGTAYTIEAGGVTIYSSTGVVGGGETITFSLP